MDNIQIVTLVIAVIGWIMFIIALRVIIDNNAEYKFKLNHKQHALNNKEAHSTVQNNIISKQKKEFEDMETSRGAWKEQTRLTELYFGQLKDKIRDVMSGRKKSFSFEGQRFRLCTKRGNARKDKKLTSLSVSSRKINKKRSRK